MGVREERGSTRGSTERGSTGGSTERGSMGVGGEGAREYALRRVTELESAPLPGPPPLTVF